MYTIKFYDKNLHIPGDEELFLLHPMLSQGANQSSTLSAQILSEHPYFKYLKQLKYGVVIYDDKRLIYKGRITEFKQCFNNVYDVYVEDKLAVLNDSPCRPHEFQGSPEELFTWFLDNHNAQVTDEQRLLKGNVTVTDPNDYINRSWQNAENTWNLMNSRLLDTLGGYFVVRYEEDGDYLDWLEDFSIYADQNIKFGENLIDLEKLVDASETYTACIPYGADITIDKYGETYVEADDWTENKYYRLVEEEYVLILSKGDFESALESGDTIYEVTSEEATGEKLTIEDVNDGRDYLINNERVALYGIIYAPTEKVTWSDVKRPENLKAKSLDWLNNFGVMLKESITLSAVDLGATGIDINKYEMYQKVKVETVPHGIETSYLITNLKTALDLSEVTQITVGGEKRSLTSQTIENNKETNNVQQEIKEIKKDYITNEKVQSELSEATSKILQTAEEIVMGILSGYTTASDLETYKKYVENKFIGNKEGFEFDFSEVEEKLTELGNEIIKRNQFIRLEEGNIIIGKSDSPIQALFTNNTLEFRYNDQTVAKFTNEVLEVRNIAVDNQVRFWTDWAIRKGAYVEGKGYNLNDVWIGG